MKTKLLVLFGGRSGEYEVSLISASAVLRNIDAEKYDMIKVGISRDGKWYLFGGDISEIESGRWCDNAGNRPCAVCPDYGSNTLIVFGEKTEQLKYDVVFPIIHGTQGEDGTVQGLFELAGARVVGCRAETSALCMDKDRAHRLVGEAGVRVPKAMVVNSENAMEAVAKFAGIVEFPLFVKPVKAGSSFGITKVCKDSELCAAVKKAFEYDDSVIIEENIDGFEVGCAVLGTDKLIVGEVDEIELSEGFFDFTEKYTLKTSKIHVPARVDGETAQRIKATARKIYRALGCSGFARVDMFLTNEGEIVFNEVNTIPGFTEHSRYPGMMRAAGIEFKEVIDRILGQVL